MGVFLELNNVTKHYNNSIFLDHVNLEIKQGCFMILFGEDNAGKTTLLHIIMGFDLLYEGARETSFPKVVRFVPDDIIWDKHDTARSYLDWAASACPTYDKEFENKLRNLFSLDLQQPLLSMTYNDNKITQIIAALCAKPEFIILDEPLNFLNTNAYGKLLELLHQLHQSGTSILLAAEKYKDAWGYADTCAMLKEGHLLYCKPVPVPDYRHKIVTLQGCDDSDRNSMNPILSSLIEEQMFVFVNEQNGRRKYMYSGDSRTLLSKLLEIGCEDVQIEDMTLEEESEQDFSRWEQP